MVEIVFTSAIHDTSLKFKVVLHSLLYIYIQRGRHIYSPWWAYIPKMLDIYAQ